VEGAHCGRCRFRDAGIGQPQFVCIQRRQFRFGGGARIDMIRSVGQAGFKQTPPGAFSLYERGVKRNWLNFINMILYCIYRTLGPANHLTNLWWLMWCCRPNLIFVRPTDARSTYTLSAWLSVGCKNRWPIRLVYKPGRESDRYRRPALMNGPWKKWN
jgi:hypothetical protein